MKTKFQILFSIEVLHNFYNTGRWDDIKIIPQPETETFLRQNEFQLRQIGNELIVIAKTDNLGKLYHLPELYKKFSFMLIPQSPGYLNFTNYPVSPLENPVSHFHNLNKNTIGSSHFLSKIIRDYDNAISYLPGDFAKGTDGKIYESISKNDAGGGSVIPDDSNPNSKDAWFLYGDFQYAGLDNTQQFFAGKNHKIKHTKSIFNFQTSQKKKVHDIHVYGLNVETNTHTKEVISTKMYFDEDHDILQVDLRLLPAGFYRVEANGDNEFIYFSGQAQTQGLPMFIDIFNLPESDPQSFIDALNKPKRTKYTIAFASRRVLWRYKTRTDIINTIEDSEGNFTFKPDGIRKFISNRPIPFGEGPKKTFIAKSGTLNITSPLPNPMADKLMDKQNEIYTTESFINF